MSGKKPVNLVSSWISVETEQIDARTNEQRMIKDALNDLNKHCGTTYSHSELSRLAGAKRGIKPQAINYMLARVLKPLLQGLGKGVTDRKAKELLRKIQLPEPEKEQ